MKYWLAAVVYTGLAVLANPSHADTAGAAALRDGDMKKLAFHAEPKALPDVEILDAADAPLRLSDMKSQWLVVNFWATWCAPCREEMPTLSRLQEIYEGQPVQVVTVATGRNAPAAISRFFEEIGVENLPLYRDPNQTLAREMGVLGLPVTVIVDPEGLEVARLVGGAEWDSESATAILDALLAGS